MTDQRDQWPEPIPFTREQLREMTHFELAELLVSAGLRGIAEDRARICNEAAHRLKEWQRGLDETKADAAEFERQFGHLRTDGARRPLEQMSDKERKPR